MRVVSVEEARVDLDEWVVSDVSVALVLVELLVVPVVIPVEEMRVDRVERVVSDVFMLPVLVELLLVLVRLPNSPSRPGKSKPRTRRQFSGQAN